MKKFLMLGVMGLGLVVAPAAVVKADKTYEEKYADEQARQEREDAKRDRKRDGEEAKR